MAPRHYSMANRAAAVEARRAQIVSHAIQLFAERTAAATTTEHIAAAAPIAVDKDQVPPETVETERRIFVEQVRASGKPENMIDKIVEGKIQAYYKDVCLLHQAWVREPKKTVGDLVREVSAKTGENVQVRRFTRYQLGEA